jgi:hypothetical protein
MVSILKHTGYYNGGFKNQLQCDKLFTVPLAGGSCNGIPASNQSGAAFIE